MGWGLPREGGWAKKWPSKPMETKLVGGISRDFYQDVPGMPEKFEFYNVYIDAAVLGDRLPEGTESLSSAQAGAKGLALRELESACRVSIL